MGHDLAIEQIEPIADEVEPNVVRGRTNREALFADVAPVLWHHLVGQRTTPRRPDRILISVLAWPSIHGPILATNGDRH